MRAIILAAGAGRRLGDIAASLPKALVRVGDRLLIDHVRRFVTNGAYDDVVVVGGCCVDPLREHVADWPGITFYENRDWTKGNILSLLAAREALEGDVQLLNVDHIFPQRLLGRFRSQTHTAEAPTAWVDFDRPLHADDMKVALAEDGRVQRISKQLTEYQAGYIGSTFVPAGFVARYRAEAEALSAETDGAANVEAILQRFADQGVRPHVFDASGIRWLEVDTPEDHFEAERILANVPGYLD